MKMASFIKPIKTILINLVSHIDFQSGYGTAGSKRMEDKPGDRCFEADKTCFGGVTQQFYVRRK